MKTVTQHLEACREIYMCVGICGVHYISEGGVHVELTVCVIEMELI